MSLLPILWAMKSAPVVDAEERGILIALAESAWSDGTDAFPSKKTIAEIAVIDPKTVQRRLKTLVARKLIAEGNQDAAAYIPVYFRPKVYDLLIPYSWYPDIDQVNAERKGRSKPPLTPEDRPDMAPAPPKKHRADKGKTRKKKAAVPEGGDYKSPRDDTPHNGQEGGTTSPGGGDYKSQTRGLEDPQPSPYNPPHDPPRPSVPASGQQNAETDGGTDGSGSQMDEKTVKAEQVAVSPGVELLLAIGAEQPEFLLSGKTLQDQGLLVTGMLDAGWTREQLRHIVAGRPLPEKIHTTVGGLISKRLRDAVAGPPPGSVRRLPEPPLAPSWLRGDDRPTPTPDSWESQQSMYLLDSRAGECVGDGGMCGRPTEAGYDQCASCMGWEFCGECGARRAPRGEVCRDCVAEQAYAGI